MSTSVQAAAVPGVLGAPAGRRPWATAALFAIPYLILMLCWAFTGPPNTGPDESDHLVKAIGMSRLDIGTRYTGPPLGTGIGMERNRSISRVIPVRGAVAPANYNCELVRPTVSAGCLLKQQPANTTAGVALVVDPLGSYPPFLYALIGQATRPAATPVQAFVLARIFCALACAALLLLGSAHLVRWLGRRALLGAFVALTPSVVFFGSIVTTSGIEICAAFTTVCIVVAALRRRESLVEAGSQLLLGGAGVTLILSRQLGVVTFALLMLLLVIRLGPRFFLGLVTAHRPAFVASAAALIAAGLAILVWETRYDHPDHVGSAVNASAFGQFNSSSYALLRSGVALFGWLDTSIPNWFVAMWIVAFVVLLGAAVLLGSRADRWTLVLWSLVVVVVAYVTYATVFFPVRAGLQGRHILAVFMLLPMLAGVAAVDRLDHIDATVGRRMFRLAAVVMPVLQFVSLYLNSRRYAVGVSGAVWFLPSAQWQPPLGWAVWLIAGAGATAALAWRIWSAGSIGDAPARGSGHRTPAEGVHAGVER